MEKELIKEIPCLPLDKLMSIFKPDKDDVYRHGLLIGRRSAVGDEHADISFVHPFSVNAFILICCDRGEVSISTNSEEFDLKPGTLYINFPGQIMRASRIDNCTVQVAVIDLNLIRDMSLDVKPMAQKLLALKYAQCMQLETEAFKETECLIDSIADEIRNNEEDALSTKILVRPRSLIRRRSAKMPATSRSLCCCSAQTTRRSEAWGSTPNRCTCRQNTSPL